MDILQTIKQEFNLTETHTKNIVSLIDEGNTIPFIARYRKEMTGSCDDHALAPAARALRPSSGQIPAWALRP